MPEINQNWPEMVSKWLYLAQIHLFNKLMEQKVPLCILLCLIFWYLNMTSIVKWGSETSNSFPVPLGIKHGGINSPEFFSCYFDGLTKILREKKIGCHIYKLFLAITHSVTRSFLISSNVPLGIFQYNFITSPFDKQK